ncbi:heme-binding protein [uncultured Salinisphaera sp.]|uniref:heme-binding protein n=1 Tax=uncultured Salinisphaera sp. TaxID=359372 RepID=UPI0032B1551D|tara:strand:+ start:82 stop:486 length:405 start_codon:yes stop_codon:yes gene_type:complete
MQQKAVLGLAEVNRILDAAQAEAEGQGWNVAIAVVDDGGHPLALRRLDDCAPMGSYIATEKARSAALGRKETQVFEEMINNGRNAFLSAPVLQGTMTGGVPVVVDGQVVGAVGVSGVKPDQDAQTAKAGVAAIG